VFVPLYEASVPGQKMPAEAKPDLFADTHIYDHLYKCLLAFCVVL